MRITIKTLLDLPSLSHAKVIAGAKGLDKTVDSISVLEYAEPTALQKTFFDSNEFLGNEIAITGFINIKDDVEAQCRTIRRLHKSGEVGIILYYVGIFMPEIDQRLIDLANKLDFALICMPENRMDLKYSEVIYEVIEAIIKNKMHDPNFVSEMLERISKLSDHQRNMDTVLKMICDHTTSSIYLVDDHFNSVNLSNWPVISNVSIEKISSYYHASIANLPTTPTPIEIGRSIYVCNKAIQSENASPLHLIMAKENGILSEELCNQASEIVQLFINIWSKGHGKIGTDELIRAILNDEPIKMRRLAEILNINILAIHHLIMLVPKKPIDHQALRHDLYQKWQKIVEDVIRLYFNVTFTGTYNDTFVIFLGSDKVKQACKVVKEALEEALSEQSPEPYVLVTCYGQANTTDVRNGYLLYSDYLSAAKIIFPLKTILSLQELRFTKHCYDIISNGENSILEATKILLPLDQSNHSSDALKSTLAIYLLDAASNVALTADYLYVHKNTIKYRIHQINEYLHFDINKMPEHYDLYCAVAIERLLESLPQTPNKD
ncbi:PucR family transcriptional regulator [Fusibacter ferrireducens]|uniref:PucR family transcriptional regulator n=1 Tax=Fusibacter ferrireducens TaxID=2785058 RepID=A0ABR9ZSD2_9FIRM|nr:PucR family transcriptional regulator [Fusibacter ferrireducens]MBF4693367.1 PucR family transcriptional regulator [Fusibacter ferrireducens]